jgi:hypothetical protein
MVLNRSIQTLYHKLLMSFTNYILVVFFSNVISFIQMLATINTPKVQAPFGVSLLHLVCRKQNYFETYSTWIQDR